MRMMKEQSERIDIKQKLTHLCFLQNQVQIINYSLKRMEEKMSEDNKPTEEKKEVKTDEKSEEKNKDEKEVKKDQ